MTFELIAVLALCLATALTVFGHFSKKETLGLIGKLTSVVTEQNHQLEYLLQRDIEFQKHAETVRATLERLTFNSKNETRGVSMDDIVKNMTAGAVRDEDFGD